MPKRYVVALTPEERESLRSLARAGRASALTITRARILLKADQAQGGPAWGDRRVAAARDVHPDTVADVRRRFAERGLEGALERKRQEAPSTPRRLDGRGEARLIALACSGPPD